MYKFPIQITKTIYGTKFGGYSKELSPKEVGINKEALKEKGLPLLGKVQVRESENPLPPAMFHEKFGFIRELRPLDKSRPHALGKSQDGEIVSSPPENINKKPYFEFTGRGRVIINFTPTKFDIKELLGSLSRGFAEEI